MYVVYGGEWREYSILYSYAATLVSIRISGGSVYVSDDEMRRYYCNTSGVYHQGVVVGI